jgi:hypothetical protein
VENIISHCNANPSFGYAYFFFDGRDSQKGLQLYENLVRSLISQFSDQCDGIPTALVGIYGNGHQQPSTDSLRYALLSILQGFEKAYVIIDSLDECTERALLLSWIKTIVESKLANIHLLVTSRQERGIEDRLQLLSPRRVCLEKESDNRDIEEYLDRILQTDSDFKQWGEKTQGDIRTALMKGGQGMYASFVSIRHPTQFTLPIFLGSDGPHRSWRRCEDALARMK